ncbi:MAG: altronate dehydratase, partial [Clostridia bacterium]|nr:altronate dehydratase [Clostridia bacterium]
MDRLVQIAPRDMVAVALQPIRAGEPADCAAGAVTPLEDIPMGHKVALCDIRAGEPVIKYGFPIGKATRDIRRGEHVHTHNLKTGLSGALEYEYHPTHPVLPPREAAAFMGYPRAVGRAGIRNELWIIPTVGCVNDNAQALARMAQKLVGGSVEGVYAFAHPYGCSQMGGDQENTRQALANLVTHPNAGGVLLLGLGCENSGVGEILARLGEHDPQRLRTLICQDVEDELEAGMALIEELAARMRGDVRKPCPASDLVVGLKCGGSDGLSGITANPTVGRFSDRLIALGGSTVLTEVPEMFGAENILFSRCLNQEVFDKAVGMVNDFKQYFVSHGQVVYENPSPGNKAGGITTLEDKSCGCVQKGGSAQIV